MHYSAIYSGWIHQQLAAVDPRAAQRFLPSDRQRVMRALEVYRVSGRAISDFHDEQVTESATDDFKIYALAPDRAWLHERIALRLEQMWQGGLIEEVQRLRQRPLLTAECPSMRSVGYRQVWEYLEKLQRESSVETNSTVDNHQKKQEMQDRVLFATRQLAKRQYTWIRSLRDSYTVQSLNTLNEGLLHLLR